MPSYLHPGVYVEEIPSGVKPIEGVPTSIAAFIGYTAKGPIGEPELIFKWDDYDQQFGGIRDMPQGELDAMGYSVFAFYQNGGKQAYMVRLADGDPQPATALLPHPTDGNLVLAFSAVNEGEWGDALGVTLTSQTVPAGEIARYTLSVSEEGEFGPEERELFQDLTLEEGDPDYMPIRVEDGSSLVRVEFLSATDDEFLLGTSTSGDLSALVVTDLNGQSMTVTVDGTGRTVAFGGSEFDASSGLADVAEAIQDQVRIDTNDGTEWFTAEVAGVRIVLTSGSRETTSSVVVTGPGTDDAADTLGLGVANDGVETAGDEWLDARFAEHFLGTSTSGDLSALDPATLNSLALEVLVDTSARNFSFGASEFDGTSTLEDVALSIETAVRGSTTLPQTAFFTAEVDDGRIVLTSGTRLRTSAVVVTGAAAVPLAMGDANGGEEMTGQDHLAAVLAEYGIDDDFAGGDDGDEPGLASYVNTFTELRQFRDVNIICLPGQVYEGDGASVIDAAISHAEFMRSRLVIVDPPEGTELVSQNDVAGLGLPTSTYSVLYYPWVRMQNPHYNAEKRPDRDRTVLVPPCGAAAGMWGKIDGRRGVWKAPAGTETALAGALDLQFKVGNDEQDQLNPLGVNCYRRLQVPGLSAPVIWGSRTLATKADPEWRYVPVRRTAIFIEQSLYNGIQWAVFEPNDHRLWASLRVNIESFMNGLHRAGAFQGEKASDAYFVRCGLGDTMTQGDIDRGQVIVIVGFAPLKPAEFVIIRLQQKVAQQ